MRVIAIDPGTNCGYAYADDGKVHVEQSGVWDLKPRRHEGGGMRYLRVKTLLRELLGLYSWKDPGVTEKVGKCAVFYEEVRGHKGTDAAHIYGGIVATIASLCEEHGIPYQGIPVGTIKKRATGKGNANKQAMIEAACEQFGPVTDDNQADALHLLVCGLEDLGIYDG